MLRDLKTGKKVVGLKQSRRAIEDGQAQTVFIARDADERIAAQLTALAAEHGVEAVYVDSMLMLGNACGIQVGAAVAVLLKD